MDKIPKKPTHPGYKVPHQSDYRLDTKTFYLYDEDILSPEFIAQLSDLSDQGYICYISSYHYAGYRDESCDLELNIYAYLPDVAAYQKAKDIYDAKIIKYNKDHAIYEAYMKEEAKRILTKEEQDAKKKRFAEYLKLKKEFEGK